VAGEDKKGCRELRNESLQEPTLEAGLKVGRCGKDGVKFAGCVAHECARKQSTGVGGGRGLRDSPGGSGKA